jgi:4-carboxymuconolactone decarboxylase
MKSRLSLPDPASFTPEQRAVYDSILSTRGNIEGPFLAWLHSPALASPAEKLGAFCRYGTVLSLVESELLILTVAGHHNCIGEQQIHEPIARKAGLSEDSVQALRRAGVPALTDARQEVLHALAHQLLSAHRIEPATYEKAVAAFGERGVVEAVGVIGYYTLVAHTLNAFEMSRE